MPLRSVMLGMCVVLTLAGWAGLVIAEEPTPLAAALKTLRAVEPMGRGNDEAARAWQQVAGADAGKLPTMLAALDGASPLAANWICAAIDAVAERQLAGGGKLPAADLEAFVNERTHDPRGRRLAFEWLARFDATAPDRLIPAMLDDPSLEMRRDAVARALDAAAALAKANNDGAAPAYRRALTSARDLDQVKLASEELKKLGQPVDLSRHFGFVIGWQLVGPFDNKDKRGYPIVYPPEEHPGARIDPAATFPAGDAKLPWVKHVTADEYGSVDLNQVLGKHMGVVGYASAEFVADKAQNVELRLGCENAHKLWLNGQQISAAEVYHSNVRMDQYVARGVLKPGINVILLKVCQNEQTDSWAQDWKFQLRVCDAAGTAVLAADRPATGATAGSASAPGAAP
jgi:hypothetical protein